eukprot:354539-Chlamydomonas_euryale.AAC.1
MESTQKALGVNQAWVRAASSGLSVMGLGGCVGAVGSRSSWAWSKKCVKGTWVGYFELSGPGRLVWSEKGVEDAWVGCLELSGRERLAGCGVEGGLKGRLGGLLGAVGSWAAGCGVRRVEGAPGSVARSCWVSGGHSWTVAHEGGPPGTAVARCCCTCVCPSGATLTLVNPASTKLDLAGLSTAGPSRTVYSLLVKHGGETPPPHPSARQVTQGIPVFGHTGIPMLNLPLVTLNLGSGL